MSRKRLSLCFVSAPWSLHHYTMEPDRSHHCLIIQYYWWTERIYNMPSSDIRTWKAQCAVTQCAGNTRAQKYLMASQTLMLQILSPFSLEAIQILRLLLQCVVLVCIVTLCAHFRQIYPIKDVRKVSLSKWTLSNASHTL